MKNWDVILCSYDIENLYPSIKKNKIFYLRTFLEIFCAFNTQENLWDFLNILIKLYTSNNYDPRRKYCIYMCSFVIQLKIYYYTIVKVKLPDTHD